MVLIAENMKKSCHNKFFKDDQNCTSLKDECNLKILKTRRTSVFFVACPYMGMQLSYSSKFCVAVYGRW